MTSSPISNNVYEDEVNAQSQSTNRCPDQPSQKKDSDKPESKPELYARRYGLSQAWFILFPVVTFMFMSFISAFSSHDAILGVLS
jgi:hypothetical protein